VGPQHLLLKAQEEPLAALGGGVEEVGHEALFDTAVAEEGVSAVDEVGAGVIGRPEGEEAVGVGNSRCVLQGPTPGEDPQSDDVGAGQPVEEVQQQRRQAMEDVLGLPAPELEVVGPDVHHHCPGREVIEFPVQDAPDELRHPVAGDAEGEGRGAERLPERCRDASAAVPRGPPGRPSEGLRDGVPENLGGVTKLVG
jgi:hypothetical protein